MDDQIGALISFNMVTFSGASEASCPGSDPDTQSVPPPDTFNPVLLGTDQWVSTAKAFGAKHIFLAVSELSGFATDSSNVSNYTVREAHGGKYGDIAQKFVASCRKQGVRPGFFYSVHFNYHRHVCGFTVSKPGPGRGTQHDFDVFAAAQLTELAGYGPEMLWLDGVMDSSKLPLVKQAVATHLSGVACHSCVDSHGNDPAVLPMANTNGVRWTSSGEEAIAPYPLWAANSRCDQATAALPGSRTGSDFCVPSADTVLREHDWYWTRTMRHGSRPSLRVCC